MRVEDKVVIITGASQVLEKSSKRICKRGRKSCSRCKKKAKTRKAKSKDFAGSIFPFQVDVGKNEDIKAIITFTLKEVSKIDVLINNAGIIDEHMPAGEMTDEIWDYVVNINFTAPMKLTREVLLSMVKARSGNIINLSSVGGLNGGRGGAADVSTKHTLIGLTKNPGFIYADQGIRCNAICPGSIPTKMSGSNPPSELGLSKIMSGFANAPRIGTTEEIANILVFLASDESSLINIVAITADAGWTAY